MWISAARKLGARQCLAGLAQEQTIVGRDAVGVGRHLAFEDVDVATGKEIAQVIVGAAVAQADLEDRSRQLTHLVGQKIQAIALRFHARDEAVEAAHGVRPSRPSVPWKPSW